METQNIGRDTWRFVDDRIDQMTDWSLGQKIQELEAAMVTSPAMSGEIYLAIARIEEELDTRELQRVDPVRYQEREALRHALAAL